MPKYFPDFEGFVTAARESGGAIVPVYRQLLADHLTPVMAFEVLGRDAHAFLFESVATDDRAGRYSFIATAPSTVFTAMHGAAAVQQAGRATREFKTVDPLVDAKEILPKRRLARFDESLPSFTGGLVGYAGYDVARYYAVEKLPNPPPDDRGLPEVLFGLYHEMVIFDHVDKTMKVVANASLDADADDEAAHHAYADACLRVDLLVQRLSQPTVASLGEIDPRAGELTMPYSTNLSQAQFQDAVRRGRQHVRDGDVSRLVPSLRVRVQSEARPFDVYRALRVTHPSPHMFYLKSPSCTLVGSSPQILCSVVDQDVDAIDVLRASLPAEMVTGAPQARAMQILDDLEPNRRGPWAGAVGHLDFAGNMQACLATRTMVWRNGAYDVQVVTTVVADTDPSAAFEQTMARATPLLRAVELASKCF